MATATYASIADLVTAEALATELQMLLADREQSVLMHPALFYAGDSNGAESLVKKIPQAGLMGYDVPSAVAVDTDSTDATWTDASVTLTPARQVLSRTFGDGAMSVGSGLTPELLALDAAISHAQRLIALIAAAGASATTIKGTTATALTWSALRSAGAAINQGKARGRKLAILKPQAADELIADISDNAGGALQYTPAAQAMALAVNAGYVGSMGDIDIYSSDRVTDDSTDYLNVIFAAGGMTWADMTVQAPDGHPDVVKLGKVLLERKRTPGKGITRWVSSSWLAATIGQQGAIAQVLSGM